MFTADPEVSDSRRQWMHWHKSFTTYLAQMPDVTEANKLSLLINHIDAAVYELISEAASYEEAIQILTTTYATTPNSIFARYALMSSKQQTGESLDCYLQKLKRLSVDCNYQAVSAQVHKEEAIRDAFIAGVISSDIRKRLLENDNLTLQAALDKARSLETAQKNAEMYRVGIPHQSHPNNLPQVAKLQSSVDYEESKECPSDDYYTAAADEKCMFCENKRHPRKFCPARSVTGFKYSKRGHFSKVCRSNLPSSKNDTTANAMIMGISANVTHSKVNIPVFVNGSKANALFDTGSTLSHLSNDLAKRLKLKLEASDSCIGLAVKGCTS